MAPNHSMIMFILLLFFLHFVPLNTSSSAGVIRMDLAHVHAGGADSNELVWRAISRSHRRVSALASLIKLSEASNSTVVDSRLYPGQNEFYTNISIGTPPQVHFPVIIDTGSDLIWTQCQPCEQCFSQQSPIFDPSKSSSFHVASCSSSACQELQAHWCGNQSCQYLYGYASGPSTEGVLATESLVLGGTTVASVVFGCGNDNSLLGWPAGSAGLLGLGRGPLSLVSQIASQRFSYCLTPMGFSKSSSLLLGASPPPSNSSKQLVVSTPILSYPDSPSFYYLNLTGITVGETTLNVSNSDFFGGNGGMFIDSGTYLTFLPPSAFGEVQGAFRNQMKLNSSDMGDFLGVGPCFDVPENATLESLELPGLIFHFEGGDLSFPRENYFALEQNLGIVCLMIAAADDDFSIFGNLLQQNIQVWYDLKENVISFSPTQCG